MVQVEQRAIERERPRRKPTPRTPLPWTRRVLLAVIGAGCGASALLQAYYDITVWGPITIGLAALLVAFVVGSPARPTRTAAVGVGALGLLWLWSWLSTAWAESNDQALELTAHFALYAIVLALLLLLLRRRGDYWALLPFLVVGVAATALWVVVTMISGDAASLFNGGRLLEPLGYVNGEAGFFLVGAWPLIALAEQTRSSILAGLGMAGAFIVAALVMLGQTRGALPGTAVSAVVLVAVVPGRARRLTVLLVIAAGLALISHSLLDVYRNTTSGHRAPLDLEIVRHAGRMILLVAAIVGVGWAAAQAFLSRLASSGEGAGRMLPWIEGAIGAVLVVMATGAALVAIHHPIRQVKHQYNQFVNLKTDQGSSSRFSSGGGYRYDYWRVAWHQFRDHPLAGVGAGNYDRTYFLKRRTIEDIRQPHSVELQVLGELGLIGGIALLTFIGAVLTGLWRAARRAREDPAIRIVAVAGGGAFIAWLVHTSVDWLHLLPGVTGIALCGAAMLLAPWMRPVRSGFPPTRILVTVAVTLAALAGALLAGRLAEADHLRGQASARVASDPVEALRLANKSLSLNGDSVSARYVKSAAYARLGRYRPARQSLREAARLEPHNPVPWALLGDLAARRHAFRAARRYYRRALHLDPRQNLYKNLAANPRSALAPPTP